MTDFQITVRKANGNPGSLTKDDIWGTFDDNYNLVDTGMIIAQGTPEDSDIAIDFLAKRPRVCPVWGDKLPYKSVTVVCHESEVDAVMYWLEYVHGGGSVQDSTDLPHGMVAIRSDYMCW